MLYARKLTEDGWFGKNELDADSISELGTSNHDLSVWKIDDVENVYDVDQIALAIAMGRTKIDELYIVFLDPNDLEDKFKWVVAFSPQDGDTKYTGMKGDHTNFVVPSFWEQGYLAIYIHQLLEDESNFRYYDVEKLRRLAYNAIKQGTLTIEEIKGTQWKKAVEEIDKLEAGNI